MKKIELFDYQEDMKARIEKALCLHRSVMAQMPTGTGKTVLLASVVESFLREHSNCNVWIVAHRRELVSQIRETIERVFSKITPSLFTLKEGSTSHPDPLQWSLHPLRFPRFRGTETSGARGCNRSPVLYLPHLSLPSGRVLTLYPSPKSLP